MKRPWNHLLSGSQTRLARSGFALTLTLILVTLTAIVVVAFLTTTSTERATAAAYGRLERAREMAEAGADAAIARLITEMKYRPYHAIGYRSVNVGSFGTQMVPVITGPRTTTPATTATYNTAPTDDDDVYLVSVTSSGPGGVLGSSAPTGLTTINSVDLNANNVAFEPKGWIGSPTTATTPVPFRVPWIDVLADPTKTLQPDPGQPNYNPVIGRYGYWIEDETSKLDASLVGNQDGGGAFKRGDGVDLPTATPSRLAVNDLDIGALPLVSASPLPSGDTTTNKAVLDFRSAMPMLDARFLNRAGGQMTSDVAETTKYYSTVFSLSNDLAGNGRRRANINALVTNTSAPEIIAANIDDIGYVITGKHLMDETLVPNSAKGSRVFDGGPTTTNTLSSFGLRFFTNPTPSSDQQNLYVERIAANIRDYIDSDNLATYIDTSDTVIANVKPALAWKSGSEPRAVGKEAVPILQEIAWYGYQRKMEDDPGGQSRSYDVDIDFYFEFFNPSTKDFVAPSGAFLKVYNCAQWSAGSYPPVKPPDTEFNIGGITFPAGQAIVLTTETDASLDPTGMILDSSKVTRLSGATRNFTGHTDEKISGKYGLQLQGRAGSTKVTDYSTEAVWGTPTGIYEGIGYVSSGGDGSKPWNMDGEGSEMQSKTRFVYTYSLRGNDDNSRTGDPRSLSEQLSMSGGLASLGNDQTRFYANVLGTGALPGSSTFGKAKISFVDTTKWPDYAPPLNDTKVTGYAVQADAPMQSIGELGNVYDPVRTIANTDTSPVTPSILRARGGGRTLKIGQIDDRISGSRFSSTWFNASWRLVDLFSANTSKDASGNFLKISPPTSRGKINVNGVLRDGGVAFKAALRSFVFKSAPDSDQNLSGKTLSDTETDKLISDLTLYLTTNGPMMERGELSQLPFFNSGTAGSNNLGKANDRGREEIFRRCVEMITTRSASFTVYAIGQAVRQDKNGTKTAIGEKRMATTFQLQPKTGGALLEKSTKPYDVVDSYSVKKVYAPN